MPDEPHEPDTGEPISELTELLEPPPAGFHTRIHNSIQRRILVGETIDFSLSGLFQTLLSYLMIPLELLGGFLGEDKKPEER